MNLSQSVLFTQSLLAEYFNRTSSKKECINFNLSALPIFAQVLYRNSKVLSTQNKYKKYFDKRIAWQYDSKYAGSDIGSFGNEEDQYNKSIIPGFHVMTSNAIYTNPNKSSYGNPKSAQWYPKIVYVSGQNYNRNNNSNRSRQGKSNKCTSDRGSKIIIREKLSSNTSSLKSIKQQQEQDGYDKCNKENDNLDNSDHLQDISEEEDDERSLTLSQQMQTIEKIQDEIDIERKVMIKNQKIQLPTISPADMYEGNPYLMRKEGDPQTDDSHEIDVVDGKLKVQIYKSNSPLKKGAKGKKFKYQEYRSISQTQRSLKEHRSLKQLSTTKSTLKSRYKDKFQRRFIKKNIKGCNRKDKDFQRSVSMNKGRDFRKKYHLSLPDQNQTSSDFVRQTNETLKSMIVKSCQHLQKQATNQHIQNTYFPSAVDLTVSASKNLKSFQKFELDKFKHRPKQKNTAAQNLIKQLITSTMRYKRVPKNQLQLRKQVINRKGETKIKNLRYQNKVKRLFPNPAQGKSRSTQKRHRQYKLTLQTQIREEMRQAILMNKTNLFSTQNITTRSRDKGSGRLRENAYFKKDRQGNNGLQGPIIKKGKSYQILRNMKTVNNNWQKQTSPLNRTSKARLGRKKPFIFKEVQI